jgi:hypothetical protein
MRSELVSVRTQESGTPQRRAVSYIGKGFEREEPDNDA